MKDIIENFEDCAERRFDEITENLPEGKFKCPGCNEISDLDNSMPSSVNPYSMPICDKCSEEAIKDGAK